LEKLARHAPGARVYCRLLVENKGADWPLSRKFGTTVENAKRLMLRAGEMGLDPYGLSFHVGSQQTDLDQWDKALGQVSQMFFALAEEGAPAALEEMGELGVLAALTPGLRFERDLAERALALLVEEQRAALLLVVLEGLTYREVAEVQGVPIGTVMSRLHRGRAFLRAELGTPAGASARRRVVT